MADASGRRTGGAGGAAGELGAGEEASHRRRGAMGLIGGFFWRLVGGEAEKGRDLEGVGGAVGSGAGGGARARSGGGGAWLVMTDQ